MKILLHSNFLKVDETLNHLLREPVLCENLPINDETSISRLKYFWYGKKNTTKCFIPKIIKIVYGSLPEAVLGDYEYITE